MSIMRPRFIIFVVIGLLAAMVPFAPVAATAGNPEFVGLRPVRLADTRDGTGGVAAVRIAAGGVLAVTAAGVASVPLTAKAVSLNVTVTGPAGAGFVTVYPCGSTRPWASNLNFVAGQTVPNAVVVKPGAQGSVCVFASAATHVVVDLNGYFPSGAVYVGLVPFRAADTRDGTGVARAVVKAGTTLSVPVAPRQTVPEQAMAVSANVTVTEPDRAGFVTVWPCGEPKPWASNLNFVPGQTVPNAVIAGVGDGGAICLFTTATTHLLVDVGGYFTEEAPYVPMVPVRAFDSRVDADGKMPADVWFEQQFAEPGELAALILNVTVTEPEEPGFITVYPCDRGRPWASNLNFVPGQTVPNMVIAPVDSQGLVCFYSSGTTHLVVDVEGAIRYDEPQFEGSLIEAGGPTTCALDLADKAWCWGADYGKLGDGWDDSELKTAPSAVVSDLRWSEISVGGEHACGIATTGSAWCWGKDGAGQLGDGIDDQATEHVPVKIGGGHAFVTLSAGLWHTCALDAAGAAWCWGSDEQGAVGDGADNQADEQLPVRVSGDRTYTALAAGYWHTCAIDTAGAAWCWGDDEQGQVGDGDNDGADRFAPVRVAGGHRFDTLTAGSLHTCALDTAGAAWCWGYDGDAQLGDGVIDTNDKQGTPAPVVGGLVFRSITAGAGHTCAIDTESNAWCWGDDFDGQLGDGDNRATQVKSPVPVAVAGGRLFTALATGEDHTCGIDVAGGAWCWGSDTWGAVGNGGPASGYHYAPVRVAPVSP